MNKEDIICILEKYPELKKKIYARGFYFTNQAVDVAKYPFYGYWTSKNIFGKYKLMTAPCQQVRVCALKETELALIGHAYNPFTKEYGEDNLLKSLAEKKFLSEAFWNEFNEWTGVFTLLVYWRNSIYVIDDPTCMQNTFYYAKNGIICISSHTNCISDILNLEWSDYVRRLVGYKFFSLLGNSLPGDLTQFDDVRRLVPNHYLKIESNGRVDSKRFYWPHKLKLSMEEIVDNAADILSSNLKCISEKWRKPAISLTGGCDSKTTLSCAKGIYDKFSYFSYISSDSEKVDAVAAHDICSALGLTHTIYEISSSDADYKNIDAVRAILYWNNGGILQSNPNDVRKRIYFADTTDFDVEIKSWSSEIGRAYYSKRFHGRKNFGAVPTPRKCTTLYKFFFHDRQLVRQTDKVFEKYLSEYFEREKENPVEWQEQFFWEFRVPSWNGLVITGEHRYSFDITIPYNNRMLLELLLSAPIEDRINDTIYKMIRAKMNSKIDETGIAVQNLKHTQNREKAENLYYMIHSRIKL